MIITGKSTLKIVVLQLDATSVLFLLTPLFSFNNMKKISILYTNTHPIQEKTHKIKK